VECEDLASLRKAVDVGLARLGLPLATFDKKMARRTGAFGVPVAGSRGY
jgi:hypothetical protein